MQPSTAMMPNQNSDEDEETTLLLGTTILPTPPTTTADHRSLKWYMVASLAGMILLVVAGGTVLLRDGEIAAAEDLVLSATVRSSLAKIRYSPSCSSNGQDGCECAKQQFTCDPFGPEACGSIYLSPDEPDNKVNVPLEVAKDSFAATKAILTAAEGDPAGLIKLPFKLVNNGKAGDDNYDVDQDFVDAMKLDVQNYVAQTVNQAEMAGLYDGIVGNNAVFQIIAHEFHDVQDCDEDITCTNRTKVQLRNRLHDSIQSQRDSLVRHYSKYESKEPTINPTITPTGKDTGPNGWGIYYSVFVDQLLLACLQDIAVTGKDRLAVSINSQRVLVEYGWKGMKHAGELIDTYVAQRESSITGPATVWDKHYGLNDKEIKDAWSYYYKAESSAKQTCSWDEANHIGESYFQSGGKPINYDCDQSTIDFVTASSIHCKEGRRQFVTGSIINNWNTWLTEPAKQWAKLVDLICASNDAEGLQKYCQNQGEDNDSYKNNGGKAIDYINKKEEVIDEPSYVLGHENTNDCPAGTSHVSERNHCHDAYNQLATTMRGIINGVDYPNDWGTTRPSGCFLFLTGNTVHFNPGTNNVPGTGGDTLGNDRPICYSYPKQNGYIIQQTCQKKNPGGSVIATPVPCEVNGCNDYYKSMQPDRSRTTSFSDYCNAGLDGWTCCLDSSPPTTQCAGDYGSNDPCCGQGGGYVEPQFTCPHSKPTCVNYVYKDHWGTCE